MLIIQTKL